MVLQVPVFFLQIICVSVLQDLPNICAAKIQNLFEEESISERGAAIAFLSCKLLDLKGSWIAILPTVAAFVMCNAEYVLYDVKKKDILKASA